MRQSARTEKQTETETQEEEQRLISTLNKISPKSSGRNYMIGLIQVNTISPNVKRTIILLHSWKQFSISNYEGNSCNGWIGHWTTWIWPLENQSPVDFLSARGLFALIRKRVQYVPLTISSDFVMTRKTNQGSLLVCWCAKIENAKEHTKSGTRWGPLSPTRFSTVTLSYTHCWSSAYRRSLSSQSRKCGWSHPRNNWFGPKHLHRALHFVLWASAPWFERTRNAIF